MCIWATINFANHYVNFEVSILPSTCNIYENYFNIRLIYVNMQIYFVDMHFNYMRDNSVNMRIKNIVAC